MWRFDALSTASFSCAKDLVSRAFLRLDIALLLKLWDQLLHEIDPQVPNYVLDSFGRVKQSRQRPYEVASVLLSLAIEGNAKGQVISFNNLSGLIFDPVDLLVADSESPDLDLCAHAVDAQDKGHG